MYNIAKVSKYQTTHTTHIPKRGSLVRKGSVNLRTPHMNHRQLALADFNRAANHYQQACYAQAIQHYLAGLKIDPMWVEVYADLAKAYEMLGYWNQALEALEVALRLRPGYPTALRRKKRILEEKRVYDALIDELDVDLDASDIRFPFQHQPADSLIYVAPKIEREFFTLACTDTISQKLLLVVCQLIEHTYHEVGEIFQCYPQHRVPVLIEVIDQNETSQAGIPALRAKCSIGVIPDASLSDPSLPLWAAACYYKGRIRVAYRPYSNSGFGVLYSVLRHEWVHLLVDLLTRGRCANWLDEGLAQLIARPLINSEKALLRRASQNEQLLPFHQLQKPFSQVPAKQRCLAYLQSRATAEYLVQRFGFSDIRDFFKQIGAGEPPNVAFRGIFGKTEEEILVAWRMAM